MKKKTLLTLAVCVLTSLFLHFYNINEIPPCINADEAAFGYNAYSILKTGRDEYGAYMPLRFKSFEDYKLPLYTYFSVPIVAIFGLNDFSTRALNIFIGILFVPLIYLLAKEFFKNGVVALLSAFFTSLSPGIYLLSRHAHEGVIGTFFLLLSLLFLVKYLKSPQPKYFVLINLFLLLNAFSYQTGRIYLIFFFLLQLYLIFFLKKFRLVNRTSKILLLLLTVIFAIFFDFKYGLNRVNNLFFFKNSGFHLRTTEYLSEHPNRIIHNKLTEAVRDVSYRYLSQFSPEYLVINGDTNWRFGFPQLGLFTVIEYFLFFVGLYYLFKNKEQFRYLLIFLIFITPINNALTWQSPSLIRTYALLFPLILVIAYGIYYGYFRIPSGKLKLIFSICLFVGFAFFKVITWDLYFNNYPKRAMTVRAWQCGYKELVDYVRKNYDKYDKFYITDRHGQPYIYFLYYWPFDPATYQKQAKISSPDQYGFGQVGRFDKFEFTSKLDLSLKKTVFVGYPELFNHAKEDVLNKIKKIKVGTEEIFWIYESN